MDRQLGNAQVESQVGENIESHVHSLGTPQVHLDLQHVGMEQHLHTQEMPQVRTDPQHREVEQQAD
jgi:hypothetical protein